MTEEPQESSLKSNIKTGSTWKRGLYMLLFCLIYGVAELVLFAVVLFQFVSMAFTQKTNTSLLSLGQSLSSFVYEILLFLTYNSDDKPYPFGTWPTQTDSLPSPTESDNA
jgi:hypothetical protein